MDGLQFYFKPIPSMLFCGLKNEIHPSKYSYPYPYMRQNMIKFSPPFFFHGLAVIVSDTFATLVCVGPGSSDDGGSQ